MSERKNPSAYLSPVERRRFIRIIESCPLTFMISHGESGEGELLDLSLRGMRFQSDAVLSHGEKIRTVFILSNGISLDLSGIVRHRQGKVRKWIYGVEFSIHDYRDLKEHMKLNSYIIRARAEQDRIVKKELLKRRGL